MEEFAPRLDEEGQDYLRRIYDSARRMDQLINAMLDLSRVTRSKMSSNQVDLSALAQEIADGLSQQNPERVVTWSIAPGMLVKGDAHLLRILLQNLLDNAYKFTAKRSPARIEVGRQPDEVLFVRDNGTGFDMAYAEKLFSPFQRLHNAREYPGTGVGLATVQRIVQRHGGRLWAEAQPEQGATFFFALGELPSGKM
jgi:signal transduction histidine kinase